MKNYRIGVKRIHDPEYPQTPEHVKKADLQFMIDRGIITPKEE